MMITQRIWGWGWGCAIFLGGILLAAELHGDDAIPAGVYLPFWDHEDVLEPAGGRIEFLAEPLREGGKADGYPDMQFGCEAPRPDGGVWIYGWKLVNWQDPTRRAIEIVRVSTRDGLKFHGEEMLWLLVNKDWQGFANIVRRPTDGALFLFRTPPESCASIEAMTARLGNR